MLYYWCLHHNRKKVILIAITSASLPTKKRILTVCVKLFLEKGYKQTTLAEINERAGVSFSQFQNIFRAKDMEIGSASIMRGYMAHLCDEELTLEKKLRLFLTMTLRAYNVPKEETEQAIRFVEGLDIRTISEQVMQALFKALAMRFEFSLQEIETSRLKEEAPT